MDDLAGQLKQLRVENQQLCFRRDWNREQYLTAFNELVSVRQERDALQLEFEKVACFVEMHWKLAGLPLSSEWIINELADWAKQIDDTQDERDVLLDLLRRLYLNLTREGSWTMPTVELQEELVAVVQKEVMGK